MNHIISKPKKKKKNVAHSTLNLLADLFNPDQTASHDNDLKKKSEKKPQKKHALYLLKEQLGILAVYQKQQPLWSHKGHMFPELKVLSAWSF